MYLYKRWMEYFGNLSSKISVVYEDTLRGDFLPFGYLNIL